MCLQTVPRPALNLMKVIPEEKLPALKKYAYRGVDKSPISKYILQPYWSQLVLLFPLWMA
jgi:ethanolaminephosphotransferase